MIYAELVTAARHKGVVSYQDIAKLIGLPLTGSYMGHTIGAYVGAISQNEARHQRPLLSAIVVGINGVPGEGFFELARQCGKLKGNTQAEEEAFWQHERTDIYETWKTIFPKKKLASVVAA